MSAGRITLSTVLALSLAACGGDGTTTPPPTGGGPTPTPTPTGVSGCPLSQEIEFADAVLDQWYLFPDLLDNSVNANAFSDLQDYLDARVAPARAQNVDRGFTFATSIEEENELINSGSSAGFGILLAYDTVNDRVFLLEAYEAGNGFGSGMDRGTELLAIGEVGGDLVTVSSLMASGGPQAVIDALGPSEPGVSRTIRFAQVNGTVITADVTKSEFSLDPVSDRYGALVLNDGGKQVGYLNLRTFIIGTADRELQDAFEKFADEGITEFIIDFRYNGGGLVRIADLIGDFLRGSNTGNIWSETVLRASQSENNETRRFSDQARFQIPGQFDANGNPLFTDLEPIGSVAPTKVAFIGRGGTASASELVINSMIPYLGNADIALIGTNTFGKPVGQFGFDLSECDLRVRAVTFQTNNAQGQGEYYSGLASVMPNTCSAGDNIFQPLGDPAEDSVATALDFLAGRSCTAISGGGLQAQSAGGREILQPAQPNAAQSQIPGIY
ncbi:MAG: S41 family peptidase [Pseudomonadota bacterium]